MCASPHLSPRLPQIQSVSPSLPSCISTNPDPPVITYCTLTTTHKSIACSCVLYHGNCVNKIIAFNFLKLMFLFIMLIISWVQYAVFSNSPGSIKINKYRSTFHFLNFHVCGSWLQRLRVSALPSVDQSISGSFPDYQAWTMGSSELPEPLMHNSKNECCLLEHWFPLLFSVLSPSGMKLGSTPRQSREVQIYSISPKTLIHRLLANVICCTGVIVRLVSVSASDSICVNPPYSQPVRLYPLDPGW